MGLANKKATSQILANTAINHTGCTKKSRSVGLTMRRNLSSAMAMMLKVDAYTLNADAVGTSLHIKEPSFHALVAMRKRLKGCVKRQRIRSEKARLKISKLRGVRIWRFASTA